VVVYLGWVRGFPRKNIMSSISANIYFLPSQEQSVQTGSVTVCKKLATFERTQFTHPWCLVLLKINRGGGWAAGRGEQKNWVPGPG